MKFNSKQKIGIFLFGGIELLLFLILKFVYDGVYLFDRLFILSIINLFFCSHFIFPIKKMYDFIYNKRYVLACVILIVFSMLGYHGSSLSVWNDVVQPSYELESDGLVFGSVRKIRVDEYFITTPTILSQYFNNFDSKSDILMGRNSYVNMFPSLPCKNISLLGCLGNLPFLFLPLEMAFSMSWLLKIFVIFFGSFELCMLVSDKKRLYAFMGAMLITFSGASVWWSNMLILGIGAFAVVVMNSFLKAKSVRSRIIYSIIMGIIGANYLMLMYPAWQIPFGYLYLGLFIWLWINNKKSLSFKMLWYVPIVLLVMFGIFLPVFNQSYSIYLETISTVYPGGRNSVGGDGRDQLFGYYLSLFFPFKEFVNPSEFGNFMSFYPLPIILSVVTCVKKKIKKVKMDSLLVILGVVAILLSIWNFVKLPNFITKITLLSSSTAGRSQLVLGVICVLMMVRLMSKYESRGKITNDRLYIITCISIVFNSIIIALLNYYFDSYLDVWMNFIMLIVFVPIIDLLILNNKKTNNILALIMIMLSVVCGVLVNPLAKGLDVFYDKPAAKEIRDIVSVDKDSRWLAVNKHYALPNYVVANGATTINSTNYYPNMKLWAKFDKDGEYEYVYNRYAHIQVEFTNEKTSFNLLTPDYFAVLLNINDLEKLDVDYIISDYNIKWYMSDISECIYNYAGIYIFKLNKK